MSTSPSDKGDGKSDSASGPGIGTGAGSPGSMGNLFKRAVDAHKEKSAREEQTAPMVPQGIETRVCKHCGAPRQKEELVCHFCKGEL